MALIFRPGSLYRLEVFVWRHRRPLLLAQYDRHGRWKCRFCRSKNLSPIPGHKRTAVRGSLRNTTAMDGGNADFAGAKICRPSLGIKKP